MAATLQYAATLRANLVQELFAGNEDDLGTIAEDVELLGLGEDDGEQQLTLQDVDKDLEALESHELIRGILEQGRVLREYAQDVDDKLRQTEMESIQVRATGHLEGRREGGASARVLMPLANSAHPAPTAQDYIAESDSMVALHEQVGGICIQPGFPALGWLPSHESMLAPLVQHACGTDQGLRLHPGGHGAAAGQVSVGPGASQRGDPAAAGALGDEDEEQRGGACKYKCNNAGLS